MNASKCLAQRFTKGEIMGEEIITVGLNSKSGDENTLFKVCMQGMTNSLNKQGEFQCAESKGNLIK
jgi:hypothetical protein